MARTSKTKIGDGGESSDRMMRAASSGAEAVSQAHSQLLGTYRHGAEQANQNAQLVAGELGKAQDRSENTRQFDTKMAQDSAQFNQKMQQDESQFSRGLAQRQDETALEGAKAGYEKAGAEGAAPSEAAAAGGKAGAQGGGRAAQLEQEMAKGGGQPQLGPLDPESQQRLQDQTDQKLEMDGQGRWRPTAERKEAQARTQKREDFQADTERIRAMAYRDQVGVAAQKALAAGDMETYKEKAQTLANTPNDMQKRFDRMMKGQVQSTDWGELSTLAKGSEEVEPTLMADIKSEQFTPRVAAFVRAQVQKDALMSIVLSKGSTNYLEVDWTAPKMREFQGEVASMNDFMRSNPALGQLGFIQSTDDKMRFLNVMAAAKVLTGQTSAPNPSGGMMPATAPGAAAAPGSSSSGELPPGSTQVPGRAEGANAARAARAAGGTPQDALRAGQQANPTANEGDGYGSDLRRRAGQRLPR